MPSGRPAPAEWPSYEIVPEIVPVGVAFVGPHAAKDVTTVPAPSAVANVIPITARMDRMLISLVTSNFRHPRIPRPARSAGR